MEFRRSLMSLLVLSATHSAMSMETQNPTQEKEKKDKREFSFVVDGKNIMQTRLEDAIHFCDASGADIKKSMFDEMKLGDEARREVEKAFIEAANKQQPVKVLCDLKEEGKKLVAKVSVLKQTVPGAEDIHQYDVKFTEQK